MEPSIVLIPIIHRNIHNCMKECIIRYTLQYATRLHIVYILWYYEFHFQYKHMVCCEKYTNVTINKECLCVPFLIH